MGVISVLLKTLRKEFISGERRVVSVCAMSSCNELLILLVTMTAVSVSFATRFCQPKHTHETEILNDIGL